MLFKREDTQPVFSFKLRGAYNKMAHLSTEALARGVICASAGNHAQGVALAARELGCKALVVMPMTTPSLKVDAVRALGGEVVLHGDSYSDAYAHALELEAERGLTFVHPFDDPDVIAGQGTIAMEILRQHQGPIDAIFVAIGGGGLISGVAAYVKAVRPGDPHHRRADERLRRDAALGPRRPAGRARRRRPVLRRHRGQAGRRRDLPPGARSWSTTGSSSTPTPPAPRSRTCSRTPAASSSRPARSASPRSSSTSQARGTKGETYVAITCGANMNFDRLRFVAERAEVGEEREALFAVTIPEERGSFRRLCELIGPRAVTEFNYRISDAAEAHVFVGVATVDRAESAQLAKHFAQPRLPDARPDRRRPRQGARAPHGRRPQRPGARRAALPLRLSRSGPGALMRFLSRMPASWNISLFHYRNQGADYGRILVGLQVPPKDEKAFAEFLETLAYPCADETGNPAYRLFLQ